MTDGRRRWIVALAAWAAVGLACFARPDDPPIYEEYQVKAAYLYRIAQYVTWPKSATEGDKFIIGILGPDPFDRYLNDVAARKKIDDKPIVIRQFRTAADYKPCHILFVSAGESKEDPPDKRLADVLKVAKEDDPVLVVAESEGMATKGAALNFYLEERKPKFEVNPPAAKRRGLRLDAKLLQLGKPVS